MVMLLTITNLGNSIGISTTSSSVSGAQGGVIERFPLGTYIQVDDEKIMRVSTNNLGGFLIN